MKKFKRRSVLRDLYYETVVDMYGRKGMKPKAISDLIGIPYSTVNDWIRIFASETEKPQEMNAKDKTQPKRKIKAFKATEGRTEPSGEQELRARIKELEKLLEEERLRADLYDEIIKISERKYNIQIRKKAGTKR